MKAGGLFPVRPKAEVDWCLEYGALWDLHHLGIFTLKNISYKLCKLNADLITRKKAMRHDCNFELYPLLIGVNHLSLSLSLSLSLCVLGLYALYSGRVDQLDTWWMPSGHIPVHCPLWQNLSLSLSLTRPNTHTHTHTHTHTRIAFTVCNQRLTHT